jgi:cytidylate kinase
MMSSVFCTASSVTENLIAFEVMFCYPHYRMYLDAREQLRLGSVREREVIPIIDIQLEAESTQATTIACGKPCFGITSLLRIKTYPVLAYEYNAASLAVNSVYSRWLRIVNSDIYIYLMASCWLVQKRILKQKKGREGGLCY